MSTNRGKSPRQLVHGRPHTGFDAIAFGEGGTSLYFAAQHVDDRVDIHRLSSSARRVRPSPGAVGRRST